MATDAPWRVKTRPCPFYQQGRCVFERSCNFVHDVHVSAPTPSSSNSLPELLHALRDVLDAEPVDSDNISMAQEHGVSPHISGEGWTLVNDQSKDGLLSPVSLDVNLARISTIKPNNDSFDSGYASDVSFTSPQPLPSTLNLLASPFGSPSTRMGPGIGIGASRLFSHSPFSPSIASPEPVSREPSPDLDSPSTVRYSTATVEPDEDDDEDAQYATAQWDISNAQLSIPPAASRFSAYTDQPGSRFSTTTIGDDESSEDSGSDSEDPPEDHTAQLAYLVPGENDTINTFYDVYMHSPPQDPVAVDEEDDERGRSIRARVFTPPPRDAKPKFSEASSSTLSDSMSRRGESRTRSMFPPPRSVFSDSPDTPPRPLSSMSSRGRVPFGFRPVKPTSALPEMASPESIPRPLSSMGGKVPFGFRSQSRASNRDSMIPASASATQTVFASGSTSPKYARKRRISRSVAPPATAPIRDSTASSFFGEEPQTVMVKGLKSLRLSKVLTAPPSAFSFSPSVHGSPRVNGTHSASPSISAQSSRSAPQRAQTTDSRTHNSSVSISTRSSSRSGIRSILKDTPHTALDSLDNASHDNTRPPSRLDTHAPPVPSHVEDDDDTNNTIRRRLEIRIPEASLRDASPTRAASALGFTHPATSTPLPTRLLFAIASDDPEAVRHVLESGEVGAEEMESVGPEGKSAVRFALENTQLGRRMEIARVLMAFGAEVGEGEMEMGGPAMRYFVQRTNEEHAKRSSALIHRSFFRPLARVRYELVGQDRALEQLFRVLSMHSQRLAVLPVVVLLCGPSGHGKSLLARRFGALLDVPTHTVNMTALRRSHDLWQAYSMSPYEEPSSCTLAEFLINNEGKRCVVVLDEIEKVEEKTLWSLLMPWETGRCTFDANSRHIDVRNVVWLGTSNVGAEAIAEHHSRRKQPDELMSREEYVQLMKLVREPVSKHMGASILSRVTTVLPFVAFSRSERVAICAEAFGALGGDVVTQMPTEELDRLIAEALEGYVEEEGARSLYRAVSNQLLDL